MQVFSLAVLFCSKRTVDKNSLFANFGLCVGFCAACKCAASGWVKLN